MAIQWENFNGNDRGMIVDVEIEVESNGMCGWSWTISVDTNCVVLSGSEKFKAGDDLDKQRALNEVLGLLEGAVDDALSQLEIEERERRDYCRRWGIPYEERD